MPYFSEAELYHSKYRLLGLVGQGQFGQVFCAVHRQTGQLVALKSLDRQRFPTYKFLRELRFLLSLQHPNIVTCLALEHTIDTRYLVMDYCEGGTLRKVMTEENYLTLPYSLKLIGDILIGLSHAHSRDIVHCDIKPENILLSVQPTGWTARISDFGIARLKEEITSQSLGNTGSPAYMAPERFYGQYSPTSDLYSVGILLFELITGRRPFSGTPAELMSAHLNHPVKFPESVSTPWQPVITTALQKLSARRFRSAQEMLAAVRTAAVRSGLEWSLYPDTIHLPPLQSGAAPSLSPFRYQHYQPLQYPVTALAIAEFQSSQASSIAQASSASQVMVYRVENHQVIAEIYQRQRDQDDPAGFDRFAPLLSSATHLVSADSSLPQLSIHQLQACSAGCYCLSARSIDLISSEEVPELGYLDVDDHLDIDETALYGLSQGLSQSLKSQTLESQSFKSQTLESQSQWRLTLEQDYIAAIEANGCWMATLECSTAANENPKIGRLQFWRLPHVSFAGTLAPQPIAVPLYLESHQEFTQFLRLLAVDLNHVAVFIPTRKSVPLAEQGTLLQLFTRRGQSTGLLHLPFYLKQVVRTPTPYRLLLTEHNSFKSLILLDLKPYRITRLTVSITPDFLIATDWGFIIADSQGAIVCLDQEGRQVGQVAIPVSILAIVSFQEYYLLVATGKNQPEDDQLEDDQPEMNQSQKDQPDSGQMGLYTIDLRELDLDLIF